MLFTSHATLALNLNEKQIADLNACWNSVYRKNVQFNRQFTIKCFISGLGRLYLLHIPAWNKLIFCLIGHCCNDSVINVFNCFVYDKENNALL
jgi:hypothetical protein